MQFVALTAILGCFLPATVTATFWGDWGKVEHCPEGERANGFSLKTEREQRRGDDTALNAIALICTSGSRITSTQGPWVFNWNFCSIHQITTCFNLRICLDFRWGNWGGRFVSHIKGLRTIGFKLKTERPQGDGDDTALNVIALKCSIGGWITSAEGPWVFKKTLVATFTKTI